MLELQALVLINKDKDKLLNLIIVESPAKAKTLRSFLSQEKDKYEVVASLGHIRDLPKFTFGITIDNKKFTPKYEIDKDHKNIVEEIKKLAKKAKKIYIATDEDREGEAIGYHISQIIGGDNYPRIFFHEITKEAILNALRNPRKINMDMVNAQQARRLLDRIVGFKLSPLLGQKIQKGLSAGRVQSAALKMIVDREKEIQNFKPIKYFSIDAIFENNIETKLVNINNIESKKIELVDLINWKGEKIDKTHITIKDEISANKIIELARNGVFKVESIENKNKKVSPPPPFMTSTLQQNASNILGYSPSKTMQIAQKLYEGLQVDDGIMGLITYMRTDSLNIAKQAQKNAIAFIKKEFGEEYVSEIPRIYSTKQKNAQEAHEAIRPTRIEFTPTMAKIYLKPDELKLYTLIYDRFLASQSADAIFQSQNVFISNTDLIFKASGSKLVFDGFYRIIEYENKDRLLPELKEEMEIKLNKCHVTEHETAPPPRYSEASLIKTLESFDIGRPSTYAPTTALLIKREYIKINNKQIFATDIAFTIIELLQKYFLEIVDYKFSALLEGKLDEIANSKLEWQNVLWDFYEPFLKKIDDGKKNIKSLKIVTPTGEKCPKCSEDLVIRNGKYGEFIACSGYPK